MGLSGIFDQKLAPAGAGMHSWSDRSLMQGNSSTAGLLFFASRMMFHPMSWVFLFILSGDRERELLAGIVLGDASSHRARARYRLAEHPCVLHKLLINNN